MRYPQTVRGTFPDLPQGSPQRSRPSRGMPSGGRDPQRRATLRWRPSCGAGAPLRSSAASGGRRSSVASGDALRDLLAVALRPPRGETAPAPYARRVL